MVSNYYNIIIIRNVYGWTQGHPTRQTFYNTVFTALNYESVKLML